MTHIPWWKRPFVVLAEVIGAVALSVGSAIVYFGTLAEALAALWAFGLTSWQFVADRPGSWPLFAFALFILGWYAFKAVKRCKEWWRNHQQARAAA